MKKVGRPKGMTFKIKLSPEQREEFQNIQKKGTHSARVSRRARIVLLADDGLDNTEISERENICEQTVYNTLKKFATSSSIKDEPRSGRPEKFSGKVKAHIVAKACSDAPKGRSRWTLRLLAKEIMQLELVDSISKDTIGKVLKKTSLSHGGKRAGV